MGVSQADLAAYIEMVKGHVWAILGILVAMIVVLIVAKFAKKGKKHVIRWGAVLACIAAIVLIRYLKKASGAIMRNKSA